MDNADRVEWLRRRFEGRNWSGKPKKERRPVERKRPTPRPRKSDAERFWEKVEKTDGCWKWVGGIENGGYGCFRFEGRTQRAHRVAWRLVNGKIGRRLHVLHRCDNPRCVNPGHLFLGTHEDNMADKVAKGRQASGGRISAPRAAKRQASET